MTRAKRRLAAILCADVAHYSRLMEADEDGTLGRLKLYREAIGGLVERHDGRIVNTWGDAIIIEFASVIEAVRCAVEIQNELSHRNAEVPGEERMKFRIGLNLGDVMVEGDDIYGDGVNVAARLQEVAEPGGIVISTSVYDQVRSKLAVGFQPLGLQRVKNLSEPVESFRIRVGGDNAPEPEPEPAMLGERAAIAPMRGMGRSRPIGQFLDWFHRQSKMVRTAVVMIGFFFVINILTSPGHLWFQWPSLPFFLIAVLSHIRRDRA